MAPFYNIVKCVHWRLISRIKTGSYFTVCFRKILEFDSNPPLNMLTRFDCFRHRDPVLNLYLCLYIQKRENISDTLNNDLNCPIESVQKEFFKFNDVLCK